jgi:hypothetical protein
MTALLRAPSLALICALALTACAGRAEPADPDASPPVTVLQVENQTTLDVNVYVVPEVGGRERLGTATSLVTSYFTIPPRHLFGVSALRFQASPIGSARDLLSDQLPVIPGDTVVLTIPPG